MLACVNRNNPRLQVVIDWDGNTPPGITTLFVSRVGGAEFAVYEPIEVRGGEYTFVFDELLFSHIEGRYQGRLVVGVQERALIQFNYLTNQHIVDVRNPNVRTCA